MMEEYRKYREAAMKMYQEQRSLRLELRGGAFVGDYGCVPKFPLVSIYFVFHKQQRKEREMPTRFLARPCHVHELNLIELSSD